MLAVGFAAFVLVKNKKLEEDVLRAQQEAQASVAVVVKFCATPHHLGGIQQMNAAFAVGADSAGFVPLRPAPKEIS